MPLAVTAAAGLYEASLAAARAAAAATAPQPVFLLG